MTYGSDGNFGVLFVCNGNVSRSPFAARLTSARLNDSTGIVVASFGVQALVGQPMDAAAAQVLTNYGGDPSGHRARQIRVGDIERANLILAAETEQRDAVVRAVPLAWRRTFTMREFVRLGADLAPPRPGPAGNKLARRVADVAAQRGVLYAPARGADDLLDPHGRLAAMKKAGQQISRTIDEILQVLGHRVLVPSS